MVPNQWFITTVGKLGTDKKPAVKAGPFGSALKKEFYTQSGYKIYGQEQVISNNPFYGDYYIDEQKFNSLKSCAVSPGDILLSLVGTIGKVLLLPKNCEEGIINPRLLRLSLDSEIVFNLFFKYFLEFDHTAKALHRKAQGGTMGVINAESIKSLPILIPPIEEQKKIAEILSTWDKAITSTEKLIANSEQQKKALMQQLLTGKKRLLDESGVRFSGAWKKMTLGKVSSMSSGGTPLSTISEYYNGNIIWVSIADMTEQGKYITDSIRKLTQLGIDNSSAKIFPKHTILYAMYASIGECSIATKNVSTSQAILGIQPFDELCYQYLYFYLCSIKEKIKLQGQQGAQSNLNAAMVKSLSITLPSVKEQKTISTVLNNADREIELLKAKLEHLQQEKKALMQQLLSGKRRVVIN